MFISVKRKSLFFVLSSHSLNVMLVEAKLQNYGKTRWRYSGFPKPKALGKETPSFMFESILAQFLNICFHTLLRLNTARKQIFIIIQALVVVVENKIENSSHDKHSKVLY